MSRLVIPVNHLKDKVGDGGFDEENIKKAQQAIEENEVDFKPIAQEYLDDLTQTLQAIEAGSKSAESSLGVVLDPLMQLRAQGALFHYPSVTEISDVIVDFLDTVQMMDNDILEIVNAMKKAVDAILAMEVKDASDQTCVALIEELQGACARYLRTHSEE